MEPFAGCAPGCGHTKNEHIAFEVGAVAGEAGRSEKSCPFMGDIHKRAWLAGFRQGAKNRKQNGQTRKEREK